MEPAIEAKGSGKGTSKSGTGPSPGTSSVVKATSQSSTSGTWGTSSNSLFGTSGSGADPPKDPNPNDLSNPAYQPYKPPRKLSDSEKEENDIRFIML